MTVIRPATPEDDTALARLDAATWSAAVSPSSPRAPGTPFLGDRLQPKDVLVAEAAGVVIGYATVGHQVPLPARDHVLDVTGLAVDPEHRRSGVGRRLVEAVVEEAVRRGARKLALRVLADNEGARRLYAGCGFVVEGVLRDEFEIEGRSVDDVLMARRSRARP